MEEWRLIDKAKISAISSGAAASGRNIVRGGGGGGDGQNLCLHIVKPVSCLRRQTDRILIGGCMRGKRRKSR
jgi:hypothetical protein